eukprot:03746.XXX_87571_86859_1 [CDS] Oithona nana genome sequencing.
MRLSWTSLVFLCFIFASIHAYPSYFDYPYLLHQTEDEVEQQPDKRIMVPMRSSLKDLNFGKLLQGMNPTIVDNPIRKRLMLPMSKLQMPDFGSFKFTPKVQVRDYQKRLMVPLSNKNIPLPGFGGMKLNINYD